MSTSGPGMLIIGSWPVFISSTRAPGNQAPSQKAALLTRGRIASIVADAGAVQLTKVRGNAATRPTSIRPRG